MKRKDSGYNLLNPLTAISFILGLSLCLTGAGMMFFDIGADTLRIIFGILGISLIGSSSLFGWFFTKRIH